MGGYIINEDGSVTRRKSGGSGKTDSSDSGGGGCGVFILILIIAIALGMWIFDDSDDDVRTDDSSVTYTSTKPKAKIIKAYLEHNVYVNGLKGMKVHCDFETSGMKDETVYMYTYYYYSDNTTPLKDSSGNNLYHSSSSVDPYEETSHDDWWHFVPLTFFNMRAGYGSIDLSVDVEIKDSSGNVLARRENLTFKLYE